MSKLDLQRNIAGFLKKKTRKKMWYRIEESSTASRFHLHWLGSHQDRPSMGKALLHHLIASEVDKGHPLQV